MTDVEKFNWIRENLYGGVLKDMAFKLDCSRVYLSSVGAGKKEFSDKLKGRLLKLHKEINPRWLLLNEGEPLLTEETIKDTENLSQLRGELKIAKLENEKLRAIIVQQNEIIKTLADIKNSKNIACDM